MTLSFAPKRSSDRTCIYICVMYILQTLLCTYTFRVFTIFVFVLSSFLCLNFNGSQQMAKWLPNVFKASNKGVFFICWYEFMALSKIKLFQRLHDKFGNSWPVDNVSLYIFFWYFALDDHKVTHCFVVLTQRLGIRTSVYSTAITPAP